MEEAKAAHPSRRDEAVWFGVPARVEETLKKPRAARRLQSAWRGRIGRRTAREMIEARGRVQAAARGALARLAAREKRRAGAAAVRVQAVLRGMLARRRRRRLEAREAVLPWAAARAQAVRRGVLARHKLPQLHKAAKRAKRLRDKQEERRCEKKARHARRTVALRLQAVWRRRAAKAKKAMKAARRAEVQAKVDKARADRAAAEPCASQARGAAFQKGVHARTSPHAYERPHPLSPCMTAHLTRCRPPCRRTSFASPTRLRLIRRRVPP